VKKGDLTVSALRKKGDWNLNLGLDTSGILSLAPGQRVSINVNRGIREATVLAVLGPEALLEYVFPSGRSALRVVPKNFRVGTDPGRPYKNVGYRSLPKCWLLSIIRNRNEWWGSPQQVADLHQTPREQFLERWPDEEYRLYHPDLVFDPPSPAQLQAAARASARVRARITP
jgi:hypothetical protein